MSVNDLVKEIVLQGTPEERQELYGFTCNDSDELILKKFRLFARGNYTRYFDGEDAEFHKGMVLDYIHSYKGLNNSVVAAFRGAAKTSLLKLFLAFVLLNDLDASHKYIKVISKDLKNAKQIVTDVYNMLVELHHIYGDVFEKEGKIKREETQGSFTMKTEVKVVAGTVGQDQRGHLQDAYRPSWLLFEDIEDRGSIASRVVTKGIMDRCQEALDGLAKGGSYVVNCNYISEDGVIQWFMDKASTVVRKEPIATNIAYGRDIEGKKMLKRAVPTWDRFTFEDLDKIYKDAEDWYGEYMVDPSRSDDKFFDVDFIARQIELHAVKPDRESAGVQYWGDYKPHHVYGQGSDHSDGVDGDANTLVGFNFTTGEQTYSYADSSITPDLSAHVFARVGAEYGNCVYAPETNNRCGGIVIQTLKGIYQNIYQYEVKDRVGNVLTNKLGWETNRKTKNVILLNFKRDFEDGLIIIKDIELLKEMRAYTKSDLAERTTGLITRHFDLLMAAAIAWHMKDHATIAESLSDQFEEDEIVDESV